MKPADDEPASVFVLGVGLAGMGISHDFYWIGKPTGIVALGSVFSTLQVLPLLLITLDAWRMRNESCCQHLFPRAAWNEKLIRTSFWSLQIGLTLMMVLDLVPVGLYQLAAVFTHGYWYARTNESLWGGQSAVMHLS